MELVDYPWSILGISDNSDKSSIKKAYSAQVRKFRPDEHPEQFQELNEAYKYALYLEAEQGITCDHSEVDVAPSIEPDQSTPLFSMDEESLNHGDSEGGEEGLTENHKALLKQATELLKHDNKFRMKEEWAFLILHEDIFDPEFCSRLGLTILLLIHHHQSQLTTSHQRKFNKIPPNILMYLDEVFYWRQDIYTYWNEGLDEDVVKMLAGIEGGEGFGEFVWLCDELEVTITHTQTGQAGYGPKKAEDEGMNYGWLAFIAIWIAIKLFGGD